MEFEDRACPVCGDPNPPILFREANFDPARFTDATFSSRKIPEYMHARYMRCRRCELVFANPAPSSAALEALYRGASFEASRESEYAARTYVQYLRKATGLRPVATVDVGAGDGAFLSELSKNGFDDLVGFEPSEAPIAVADPVIRDRIRPAFFNADMFDDNSLGLITCFQTIEHVSAPLTLVSDMRRILKTGGHAFLIAHDVDALSAKLLGGKSPIFDIEHLQIFNRGSSTYLMRAAGFREVSVFPIYNAYPIAYWTKLFPLLPAIKDRLLRAMQGPLRALGDASLPLPAGNLGIVATK
jgi:SAM-dependent methyltransferase